MDALAVRLGNPAWYEVSLLAIGYLGIVQRRDVAASDVLAGLVGCASGPPGEAVLLAGRAVADLGTGGVTPACRQRVIEELLAALRSAAVEPRRRAAAGVILSGLGDPRPEVTTLDGGLQGAGRAVPDGERAGGRGGMGGREARPRAEPTL